MQFFVLASGFKLFLNEMGFGQSFAMRQKIVSNISKSFQIAWNPRMIEYIYSLFNIILLYFIPISKTLVCR